MVGLSSGLFLVTQSIYSLAITQVCKQPRVVSHILSPLVSLLGCQSGLMSLVFMR